MPYVKNVWLGSYGREQLDKKWLIDDLKNDVKPMRDVIDKTDLLVEVSAMVTEDHVKAVKKRGGRFVSYKIGNDLALAMESMIFNAHNNWVPNPKNLNPDAVWMNAQFVNSCRSFFEYLYNVKAATLPHLWSPFFLEKAIAANPRTRMGWPYRVGGSGKCKKINIFEPNISVVKTALIPFMIASSYYDERKEDISNIFIYNSQKIKESRVFKSIVLRTAAGQDRVASTERRYNFADAMGQEGGVVLSHHWENGLNYLYYEALYGDFPLVHNSPFLKDAGYYYEGFDVEDGVRALRTAISEHDDNLEAYRYEARKVLADVDPSNAHVIDEYDREIRRLMG